jgi:hypothetical protein
MPPAALPLAAPTGPPTTPPAAVRASSNTTVYDFMGTVCDSLLRAILSQMSVFAIVLYWQQLPGHTGTALSAGAMAAA